MHSRASKSSVNKKATKATSARKAVKKVAKVTKRSMTSFAAPKGENSVVFAVGTVKKVQGSKTVESPIGFEFTVTPALNVLTATQHRFIPGSALVNEYTEAFLVDAKGESAQVKSMTVESVIKQGSVKFTGPSFAWTKAQINSSTPDGNKYDTTFDFGKDVIGFKLQSAGKVNFTETASLKVTERSQFHDFIRATKPVFERMDAVESADSPSPPAVATPAAAAPAPAVAAANAV